MLKQFRTDLSGLTRSAMAAVLQLYRGFVATRVLLEKHIRHTV